MKLLVHCRVRALAAKISYYVSRHTCYPRPNTKTIVALFIRNAVYIRIISLYFQELSISFPRSFPFSFSV